VSRKGSSIKAARTRARSRRSRPSAAAATSRWWFVEAARSLGFGARIVSGYLYNPEREWDLGTTHAWADSFVPGAGWISFDPTNRGVGGFNLIPVAVARDIRQAMPVSGSFTGMTGAFQGMSVEVVVGQQ
jgi:hypothetical protein